MESTKEKDLQLEELSYLKNGSPNILSISDGYDNSHYFSLGNHFAKTYPNAKVYATDHGDLRPPLNSKPRNLSLIKHDNAKDDINDLVPNKKFDIIVMRKGICVCGGYTHCCGLPVPNFFPNYDPNQFFHFVSGLASKLNLNPSNSSVSFMLLHGNKIHWSTEASELPYWKNLLLKLQKAHPDLTFQISGNLPNSERPMNIHYIESVSEGPFNPVMILAYPKR